jgi:hypothetical protein
VTWQTYWLERTGQVALGLRRYHHDPVAADATYAWTCEQGWHWAIGWTGEGTARYHPDPDGPHREHLGFPDDVPLGRADPRWPKACGQGCGYEFTDDDQWQRWQEPIWTRPDATTRSQYVLHSQIVPPWLLPAGPGATYDSWWFPDAWRGADGIAYTVRCPRPDGSAGTWLDWPVDAPATGGGRWARSGDPRAANVTASPSIAIGDPARPGYYHGFLQSGLLTDHLG